ncbi:helix-turn-helix domain-containing protein [Nocardia uniformis]|uniref:Helix-turn-helix domain-containing protein n=1 Tax=Nocardia uniformis TaxID=53432 RepID=A0A849CH94_9NOCA|nr:helix-turn-helix transcriptional regulator [Nocardia uniformis]NNH72981.1 helix-turn-helix domain-containing protein [Nocardia uniformis]
MALSSPTVARWELAIRLRQRLDLLGIKAPALCKEVGITPAYWSHVMTGRSVPTEEKLNQVLGVLEFPAEERPEVLELRAAAKESGRWARFSALFGDELMRLYGLEHGSHSIREYEGVLVPAMLQTPDYIRALMNSPYGVRSAVEADQYVEARLMRQERLTGPEPLRFTAMLTESVLLHRPWGGKIQVDQLRHIQALMEKYPETVDVRVIPFDAPEYAALSGTVYLIDFASSRLPTVAWYENALFGQVVEDAVQVRNLNYVYEQVFAAMPSRGESFARIDKTARELASRL